MQLLSSHHSSELDVMWSRVQRNAVGHVDNVQGFLIGLGHSNRVCLCHELCKCIELSSILEYRLGLLLLFHLQDLSMEDTLLVL